MQPLTSIIVLEKAEVCLFIMIIPQTSNIYVVMHHLFYKKWLCISIVIFDFSTEMAKIVEIFPVEHTGPFRRHIQYQSCWR